MVNKILILGAKGMLGQELVRIFSADNRYEVKGWNRSDLDITDAQEIKQKITALKPAIIINATAYNDVDGCEKNQELARKVNGLAPGYLAKIAKKNGAILVHYSTGYVFDGEKKQGYIEDEKPNPISAYGESKLLGENQLIKESPQSPPQMRGPAGQAVNQLKYYLIRTNLLFGRPGLGEEGKKSFVELMLNLAQTKKSLDIIDNETSNPTYAPDLAFKTKELIENSQPFGIYHIVNNGSASWYEWAREIFKIKNIKIQINPVSSDKFPRPARRPKCSVLINTKLEPLRTWQEALREFLDQISEIG